MIKACFVIPIWGRAFIDRYFELVLLNHLSPGNIGAFRNNGSELTFVTDTSSAEYLRQKVSESQSLFEGLNVDVRTISERATRTHPHLALSTAYRHVIHTKVDEYPNQFLLTADSVFADGSFWNAGQAIADGFRAVEVIGLRTDAEKMEPWLRNFRQNHRALSVGATELASAAFSFELNRQSLHCWPGYRVWDLGANHKVLHSFALHPIVVNFADGAFDFEGPADQLFIRQYLPKESVCQLKTLDKFFYIDLCHQGSKGYIANDDYQDPVSYIKWFKTGWAQPFHIDNFQIQFDWEWGPPADDLNAVQVYRNELQTFVEAIEHPTVGQSLRYEKSFLFGRVSDSLNRLLTLQKM